MRRSIIRLVSLWYRSGIALVAESGTGVGQALGVNGVWGNMGVAAAPLLTGGLTGLLGWQAAFFIPGALCLMSGVAYLSLVPIVAWGYDPASGFARLYLLLAACAIGVAIAALLLPARRYSQRALGESQ